ncbi:MAG TPA: hypothetical protein VF005_06275 [Acidimicrobiales bacterium]
MLITIWAGEVVVVGAGAGAVVEGAVVGAGAGAVPVVVTCPGAAPASSGVCGRSARGTPGDELARALSGPARGPMAADCAALSRATPTVWAAAAAPQIITTGPTVATALTARAAIRRLGPEITWSQFAVADR